MKKLANRIGATILSLALLVSLSPITGFAVIANEEDTPAATTTEETEKSKDHGEADKHKETKKHKETPKETKETKQKETEAPKETEKKETEAPKESEKPETTTPKETKKPEAEEPKETKAAEPETSKEPEVTETEAPKETETSETEAPKETEATEETEATKETEATEPETSKEPEESATEPTEETEETEATEPTEETEATEPSETDDNISSGAKKTPVTVGDINAGISGGKLSWQPYEGAFKYAVMIESYNTATIESPSSPLDLKATIDNLIRNYELEKEYDGEYYIRLIAYNDDGIMIANWESEFIYKSSVSDDPGTISNISFNASNGLLTWTAYPGTIEYTISVGGYEDYTETNSFKLGAFIDNLIKSGDIQKNANNKYTVSITANSKGWYEIGSGSATITYASQTSYVAPGAITSVDCTNGTLTWDAFNGASSYYIELASGMGYSTKSTSFAIGAQIDKMISYGYLAKDTEYWVGISAYNSNDDLLAGWSGRIYYNPTVNEPASGRITGFKYSRGVLSWKAYSGATDYFLEVDDTDGVYLTAAKTNLNAQIDILIRTGCISKSTTGKYRIVVYAYNMYGNIVALGATSIAYRSKAKYVDPGTIEDIEFHYEGYMTWKAVSGASYYMLEIDNAENVKVTTAKYDINKRIDWLIKEGDLAKKDYYDLYLTACDKYGVTLAEGYATCHYKSSSTPIQRGVISGITISDNGTATWNAYNGAVKYTVNVSNVDSTIEVTSPSCNLNEYLYAQLIKGNAWYEGTYDIYVAAIDSEGFTIADKHFDFTFNREPNTPTVTGRAAAVKYKKVKKKNQTIARKKVITISGAQGTVTYKKVKGNGKILINAKTGNVTVKKKLKKGTYKVVVQVRAAGNAYYQEAAVQTVTIVIRVRK